MSAALVTGGAVRVGRKIVLHLAARGYDIALHYHQSHAEAEEVQSAVHATGRACVLLQANLAQMHTCVPLIAAAQAAFPALEVLVNNASVFERAALPETDEALFSRQIDLNFKAPFFLTQAFAERVEQGHVINVLDSNVVTTQGSHCAYLLSKQALAAFTQMAARALGPRVRVNAVCPGVVLPSDVHDAAFMARLSAQLPLGKTASVDDVAAAVVCLLELQGVTGQALFVDGGAHLL